jgi:hypothetical protein
MSSSQQLHLPRTLCTGRTQARLSRRGCHTRRFRRRCTHRTCRRRWCRQRPFPRRRRPLPCARSARCSPRRRSRWVPRARPHRWRRSRSKPRCRPAPHANEARQTPPSPCPTLGCPPPWEGGWKGGDIRERRRVDERGEREVMRLWACW